MGIFPVIESDDKVQANDKFRIDCSKSYISKGEPAITLVEIEPETGAGFVAVTGNPVLAKNWFLDWQYASDGDKVVSVRITTSGAPITVTKTVVSVTFVVDKLFATDSDLASIEHNITKYVPDGKSSFKYIHRESQKQMLEWLYINGYRKFDGSRITVDEVIEVENVRYWATYLALHLIFQDLSNQPDDVFDKKSRLYENTEHKWRENIALKFDLDGDGVQGAAEGFNLTSRNLVRE